MDENGPSAEAAATPGAELPAGTVAVIQGALAGPEPPAEAEAEARARALTQFREGELVPQTLLPGAEAPKPLTWRERLFRRGRKESP